MNLSKEQVKTMLQSDQFKGQEPSQVIHSIISQGNTIEGLDISQYDLKQSPIQNYQQSPTGQEPPSLMENIGSLVNPIAVGTGFVKGATKTFTGLEDLASKGIGKLIGKPFDIGGSAKTSMQDWANKSSNFGQSLGKGIETIGELGAGEGAIGKLATLPTSKAGTIAAKAGIGGALFGAQEAAKTGDITKAPGAALMGAIIPPVGAGIAKGIESIGGSLVENVGKALGFTGKMGVSDVTTKIPKAVEAFKTIFDNAKNIVVKDIDGVSKTFEPTKATFGETLQALKQTKENIYKQYTKLASQAGDNGSKFSSGDFWAIKQNLLDMSKDSTISVKNKVDSIISDIEDNFGTKTKGGTIFNPVDLGRMQTFIESLNKDINPLSDKAGSEVSSTASSAIREIMDNKITSSTGEGYQNLRNQYSNLKSIENDLINKWKRSSRGTGSGVANWVEGFGTLDTAVSLLTGNVGGAVKGVGMGVLGKTMEYLKNPETNLQRVFKMITEKDTSKIKSPASKFIFGGGDK